jgi:hypothetical protein
MEIAEHTATTVGWLVDSVYGDVSETSEKLKKAGLIQGPRFDSRLCGPTSLMMVMAKAMKEQGITSPYRGLIAGIKDIVKRVVPETHYTVDREVTKGVDLPNLLEAIKLEFARVRITSVEVEHFSNDLRFPQLKSGDIRDLLVNTSISLTPNDALILNISYYEQSGTFDAAKTRRLGGHYVVVDGRNQDDPDLIRVKDPDYPEDIVTAKLDKDDPKGYRGPTYRMDFKSGHLQEQQSRLDVMTLISGTAHITWSERSF